MLYFYYHVAHSHAFSPFTPALSLNRQTGKLPRNAKKPDSNIRGFNRKIHGEKPQVSSTFQQRRNWTSLSMKWCLVVKWFCLENE